MERYRVERLTLSRISLLYKLIGNVQMLLTKLYRAQSIQTRTFTFGRPRIFKYLKYTAAYQEDI